MERRDNHGWKSKIKDKCRCKGRHKEYGTAVQCMWKQGRGRTISITNREEKYETPLL